MLPSAPLPRLGALMAALALPTTALAEGEEETPHSSTVVGEARPRSSASAHALGSEEIALLPRRGAEDLLRSTPGLWLVQHGSEGKGHQVFLRGFDAGHGADFEVTMDGIPLNEWSNIHGQGYLDLGHLIPEAVEGVRVTKGPFTLGQGPFATAGSADYRLGIPEERRGLYAAYTAGAPQRHRGVLTYSTPGGESFLALEALQDLGFGENRHIDRGALLGRLRLVDDASHTLSLFGAAQLARFGLPGAMRAQSFEEGEYAFFDAADPLGRGRSGRALLALSWEPRSARSQSRISAFVAHRELEIAENYTLFLQDPEQGDRRLQEQRSLQAGLLLSSRQLWQEGVELEVGAGLVVEGFEQAEHHVDEEERRLSTERELLGTQSRAHLLGGVHLRPARDLRLFAGARGELAWALLDAREGGSAAALAPRASAAWKVAEPWRLYASYGRGLRPPEASEFSEGREMVAVDTAELGLHWLPGPGLTLGGSVFASFLESETFYDHLSARFLDLSASRRLGAELEAELRPWPWLRLSADLSYVDARLAESGDPVPYAPWLIAGGRALLRSSAGPEAGLRFRHVAPRPLPHGAAGSAQTNLDLLAAYPLGRFRLALEIENLLDTRIRDGEFYFPSRQSPSHPASELPALHFVPGPPLSARLTVSLHLP